MKRATAALTFALLLFGLSQMGSAAKKGSKGRDKDKESNYTVTSEVTMEFEIIDYHSKGEDYHGRVVIGLFGQMAPMTVFNFQQLCKGIKLKGKTLEYKGTTCHRHVTDMLIQCGDVVTADGSGSESAYGGIFRDEGFKVSHSSGGIVSMANKGPDSNGSQFFILFTRARYLDNFHVAFGKVVKGWDTMETMNEVGAKKGTSNPAKKIFISDCKVADLAKTYALTETQMNTNDLEA